MRRCEKGEKIHFLQLSNVFFREFSVRRLLRAPGGDTMLRIYMQAHCWALETGGAIRLHGDMEPAEEIAILIGAPDEEIPMIATTMQYCLECGLIKTEGSTETEDMVVNFTLTGKFTRAWTREALERREKKAQELLETRQEDATALIEMEPEQPEKKPDKKRKSPLRSVTSTDSISIYHYAEGNIKIDKKSIKRAEGRRKMVLKSDIVVDVYDYEDGFMLDIVETGDRLEDYLYKEAYQVKDIAFAMGKDEIDKRAFLRMVQINLPLYEILYEQDYNS